MISRASVIALGVGLAACVIPEDEVSTNSVEQPLRNCTDKFCGSNSPAISVYATTGFTLDHTLNHEGFALLNISRGNWFFDLAIINDRIVGKDGSGKVALYDDLLRGAKIWVQKGSQQFAITIADVGVFEEVTDYPLPQTLQTYVLQWDEALSNQLPGVIPAGTSHEVPVMMGQPGYVCPEAPDSPVWVPNEWDESQRLGPYQSIVFQGDEIFVNTRTIAPQVDDRWFNIGCGTHTLAKMRLTRNTMKTAQYPAWERSQTVMKMLSADYCGRAAFTVPGHPIVWRDGIGMQDYWTTPTGLEARWNQNGAMCLETPRMYSWLEIRRMCRTATPPPCGDPDWRNWEKELVTSGN